MAETKIINVGNGNTQKQLQVTDVTKNIADISKNTVTELTPTFNEQKKNIIEAIDIGTRQAVKEEVGDFSKIIGSMNKTIDDRLQNFLIDFKRTQPVGENEKKSTTTNSFDIVFNASEKTFEDAKKAIENKKKLIVNESSLDDNIKKIYPNIESKDDEKPYTLKNTLDNLKILMEVEKIKILKQIYPKIQEYLNNWRDTYDEKENCDRQLVDVTETANQWKDDSESKDTRIRECKNLETKEKLAAAKEKLAAANAAVENAARKAAENQMPPYVETEEEKAAKAAKALAAKKPLNGGNKKSKEYIKYKKEYLTLKQELKDEIKQLQNQLHK